MVNSAKSSHQSPLGSIVVMLINPVLSSDDKWSLLLCPVAPVVDRTVPNDDCSTWPVVNPSERKPSLLLALVGGRSQNQNRHSPLAHEEKYDAARARGPRGSTEEHGKVAVFSMPGSRTKFGRAVHQK